MNAQVTIIEPESLEYLPAKTLLRLVEQSQKAKRFSALFQATVNAHVELFRRLEELDIEVRFSLADGDINMELTGDGPRLAQVWKEMRRHGWRTNSHPEKGKSTFYAHWHKDNFATFWMQFSSTVCRRVQVGTKMVEQPVYEVQCGELPTDLEIEAQKNAVVEVDDVPF